MESDTLDDTNHGFLLGQSGWSLSPAYDMNPVYHGTGLTLNISETDNSLDFDLARSVARYFRINAEQSALIISEVKDAVRDWQKIAKRYSIPKTEQDRMAQAFEKANEQL